jgi:transposase
MVPDDGGVSRPAGPDGVWQNRLVPMRNPHQITLDDHDQAALSALLNRPAATQRQVLRARIVLAAAEGQANTTIANRPGVCVDTVGKWRRRFYQRGMAGLVDRPRTGRPPRCTLVQVAQVKALACELPATRGIPLSRWSSPESATEAVAAGLVVAHDRRCLSILSSADDCALVGSRGSAYLDDLRTRAGRISRDGGKAQISRAQCGASGLDRPVVSGRWPASPYR